MAVKSFSSESTSGSCPCLNSIVSEELLSAWVQFLAPLIKN